MDFNAKESEDAADYLSPFLYTEAEVKPKRITNNRAARAEKWWHHGEKRPAMRVALKDLTHYIATPETAKHRFFVKFPVEVAPEHSLIVIPRQDDVTRGMLSSRLHVVWAMAKGGRMGLGNDSRYNSLLTFETFPFPQGFDFKDKVIPNAAAFKAIAAAAASLQQWRENWARSRRLGQLGTQQGRKGRRLSAAPGSCCSPCSGMEKAHPDRVV